MRKLTKIVFLDFDGVLLPDPVAQEQVNQGLTRANYLDKVIFDAQCLSNFMNILNTTHAEIVLSTSWALGHSFSQITSCLERNGISTHHIFEWEDPSEHTYMTPRKLTSYRQHEISWWLQDHPEITEWVALDDMQGIASLGPRAIVTDPAVGLTHLDAAKAMAILG